MKREGMQEGRMEWKGMEGRNGIEEGGNGWNGGD